jgi:hypothetical protein
MIMWTIGILLCGAALGCLSGCATARDKTAAPRKADRPIVGAIRWDGWNEWDVWQRSFDPPEWHYRLPFFASITPDGKAQVREDSQEAMDKEIAYAKAGGLDYWAFCWYHPDGWPPNSAHMAKCFQLYLSSKHKSDISYALILAGGPHLGPKERLSETLDYLVGRFKDSNYQKVMGNRPLVFSFQMTDIVSLMGSDEAARGLLDDLRKRTVAAGLGEPYLVDMTFSAPSGAAEAEKLGCDALGTYAGFVPGNDNKEHPYTELAEANRKFWEDCKGTGKQVVPTANAGWDYRPMKQPEYPDLMIGRNLKADWVEQATPREIASNVQSALDWVKAYPSVCPANAVLIYAWNELSEGGWLVPTLSEGTARLDALSKVLGAR